MIVDYSQTKFVLWFMHALLFFCGNMHALQPREATSALALYHEGPAGKGFSE
jgi:hypothetical protein